MTEDDRQQLFQEVWEGGPQLSFEMVEAGVATLRASAGKDDKAAVCDIFVAMWGVRFPEWKLKNTEWGGPTAGELVGKLKGATDAYTR